MWFVPLLLIDSGVPVVLPSGEAASAWEEPLRLAGLDAAASGTGAYVRIVGGEGMTWIVEAHDGAGYIRSAVVGAPRTDEEREDVVFLARSLVETRMADPSPPDALAPIQVRAPSLARPVLPAVEMGVPIGQSGPAVPDEPLVVAVPAVPEGERSDRPRHIPRKPGTPEPRAATVRPTRPAVHAKGDGAGTRDQRQLGSPWLRVGSQVTVQGGANPAPGIAAEGGVIIRRTLELGVTASVGSPTDLAALDGREVGWSSAQATAGWSLGPTRLSASAGLARASFAQDADRVASRLFPDLGLEVAVPVRLARHLDLHPALGLATHIGSIEVSLAGDPVGRVSALQAAALGWLVWRP
jgi:hypothetical protein